MPSTNTPPGSIPGPPSSFGGVTVDSGPIPNLGNYADIALQAKTAYQQALAQINSQRQGALRSFGYTAGIDPNTGMLTDMKVDPNNPYGQYEQMLNTHAQTSEQAKYSAEARGLGHGGLAAQGITAEQRSFGADASQLGQNLIAQLEGLQAQQQQAQTYNDALYQAELAAARDAILNQQFNTPDASGASDGGFPGYDPTTQTVGGAPIAEPLATAMAKGLVNKNPDAGKVIVVPAPKPAPKPAPSPVKYSPAAVKKNTRD